MSVHGLEMGLRAADCRCGVGGRRRTAVGVPFFVVYGAVLLAEELLVHDLFELDHVGGLEGG